MPTKRELAGVEALGAAFGWDMIYGLKVFGKNCSLLCEQVKFVCGNFHCVC